MFRLSIRAIVELVLTLVLGLAGLAMIVGTVSKYKAGRAFDQAMNSYADSDIEATQDYLNRAIDAKSRYTAPQEAMGKILIDDGRRNPAKYAEAEKLFQSLYDSAKQGTGKPALAVLMGLAIAELEAARSQGIGANELREAVAKARQRLEEARELYPGSGDLGVNLATLALIDNRVADCEQLLAKVIKLGEISMDGLPLLYNLKGLLALRQGNLPDAVDQFDKVTEFLPGWEVPRLNLAAAYAQSLIHGDLTPEAATAYVRSITNVLGRLKRTDSPLYSPICQSLVIYYVRAGDHASGLRYAKLARDAGPVAWHGRYNEAVAQYLAARVKRIDDPARLRTMSAARTNLQQLLRDPLAKRRDLFVGSCLIGTLAAEMRETEAAVAGFGRAEQVASDGSDPLIQKLLPRVHTSLAALHLATGDYQGALDELRKSPGLPDQKKAAEALLAQLQKPPIVKDFEAKVEKLVTDFDLRFSARLEALSTPLPIARETVRVTLTDTVTGRSYPVRHRLEGNEVRGVLLDLPQGRFRLELQFADGLGNKSEAASREFAVDREPPRILARTPAPGATVAKFDALLFRVDDVIGQPDLATLSVTVYYPAGSAITNRILVSRGKYLFGSADDSIKKGDMATAEAQCPVPGPAPPGKYSIHVRVQDNAAKTCEADWSFVVTP